MDVDLVERAQRGDKGAYALLAGAIAAPVRDVHLRPDHDRLVRADTDRDAVYHFAGVELKPLQLVAAG